MLREWNPTCNIGMGNKLEFWKIRYSRLLCDSLRICKFRKVEFGNMKFSKTVRVGREGRNKEGYSQNNSAVLAAVK